MFRLIKSHMQRQLTALFLVTIISGCGLTNSGSESEAQKSEQALGTAPLPSPPTFVVEAPATSASTATTVANTSRNSIGLVTGAGGTSHHTLSGTTLAVASNGGSHLRSNTTTVPTASTTSVNGATSGLLAVGTRTPSNSVSTATSTTTATQTTVTSTASTTSTNTAQTTATRTTAAASTGTVPSTTPSTSRRRPNVFSGNGLLSGAGGTASRGNRQVVAPTRQGAQ